MHYSEYNNSRVGSACNFATLSTYNAGSGVGRGDGSGLMGNPPMMRGSADTSGFYLVPNYTAPGYDTLTHQKAGSCSGHFNITNAYGANADKCDTKYSRSICK
jgi:hypothetical protein